MSKDLKYYQSIRYKMVWEYDKEDEVYFVRFPELPGCLAHGKTEQEALEAALKVKDQWLEATHAAGWEIPESTTTPNTTGRITTRLPKFLHQKLVDRAEAEGVSLNQLILTFIAQGLEKASGDESINKIIACLKDEIRAISESMQSSSLEQQLATYNKNYLQNVTTAGLLSAAWMTPNYPCGSFFADQSQVPNAATTAIPVSGTEEDEKIGKWAA